MSKDEERLQRLKVIVNSLTEEPGCYQYLDKDGTVIYVGKAKNLKRRVSSYFNNSPKNRKTQILVSKIEDIKYVVVPTDEDALIQENNLIKEHQPFYNILLKDGKTTLLSASPTSIFPVSSKPETSTRRQASTTGRSVILAHSMR